MTRKIRYKMEPKPFLDGTNVRWEAEDKQASSTLMIRSLRSAVMVVVATDR